MAPRELTREEFIQVFGMEPEAYMKKHPERVSDLKSDKPKQRRYFGSDPAVREAARKVMPNAPEQKQQTKGREVAYKSEMERLAEAQGRDMNTYERVMDTFISPLEQAQKNVVAGVLAMPSSVPAVVDLVRKGVPAVVSGITSDDKSQGVGSRIASEFMNSMMDADSLKKLEQVQMQALETFKQQNPQATQEDQNKFLSWYANSDDFYNATLEELPTGIKWSQQGQTWANNVVGLGKRADQMTAADDVMQVVGGAFVGLPANMAAKLTKPVVKAVGERVANNLATRVGVRVAEAVTPLTLPLTPGNVALNAGVGVAINEGVRSLQGDDTLIDYQNLYDPAKFPEPETLVAATGITAAAIFGLPGIGRAVQQQVTQNTSNAIKRVGQSAGPTLEDQSNRLTPKLSPMTGMIDQNAPVKKGAQLYKDASDTDTVPSLDAAMSSASVVNSVEYENNALNYGILDGLGTNTVPYAEIKSVYDRMDIPTRDMFDKYVYAVQRKQDSTIYEQSLIKQLRIARADLMTANMSGNKGSIKRAGDKLVEVQQKYNALQVDDPSSRSSLRNWTRADVDTFIQAGENNPAVKQLGDAVRKVSNDLVHYLNKNGVISNEEAARRLSTRDLYVKLQEAAHPNETGLRRKALLFKDRVKNAFKDDTDQTSFINTAPREVDGAGAVVNNPKEAIVSIQEGIMEAVRAVTANNARREVIDRLDALPNARGNLLRPHVFKTGDNRTTTSISQGQYATLYPRGIPHEDDFVKVFRNGNIELWEFSDKSITKSLQFSPLASVPIFNGTRKVWQTMTTGLAAPWFAAKTFLWDAPLAQTTKNAGRSLGLADTLARRLAQGTAFDQPVNNVLDRVFDPTVFAAAGVAIPYQLGMRAARAVGTKVATDLASNSGLFNAIAKSGPQGKQFIEGVGTFMVNAFDQSALGIMSRNMSTSLSHLNDVSKLTDDYASAALKHTGPLKIMFEGYKAMLESVHMSTKTAFFMSNYGRLKQIHGNKIPQSEIKKLVHETRNLTGDMSRQSNSKFIQKLVSVVPYSNAMLQGTRHILSAAIPEQAAKAANSVGGNMLTDRNSRFWSQFTSGLLLPSLGASAVLTQWEGAEDYWYNRTPKWQQMTGIPIPNVDTLTEYAQTGKWPKFSPDRLNIIPIAPEFAIVLEPVTAGLRAMGLIRSPKTAVPQQWQQEVKDVMDQITSFSTPPIIAAIAAYGGTKLDAHALLTGQEGGLFQRKNIPTGGANADMMTTNSNISQSTYDAISAIAGSAVQIVMQTWNVADIAYEETGDMWKAADAALDTAGFEVKRRLPNIDVPGLFNARTRLYSSTPEAEYVYKTEDDLAPIIGSGRQMSVERDTNKRAETQAELGLVPAQKLKDQNLKQLSQVIYNNLGKKGPYKQAKEAAADIRAALNALEASRYKKDDSKYNTERNMMVRRIQEHTRIQSNELQTLERQLQKQIGRRFIQQYGVPFSYKSLAELVRKDVAR